MDHLLDGSEFIHLLSTKRQENCASFVASFAAFCYACTLQTEMGRS